MDYYLAVKIDKRLRLSVTIRKEDCGLGFKFALLLPAVVPVES
ncbi:MAG: hypothetical protein RIB78_02230 [Gammaproteobacteria bacterium]